MKGDTEIVVISSPGSMATRWLAQCLSRVPDVLVLHAKNIVGPMKKDPSEKDFANHDFYHEPLDDWPLNYGNETFPRFLQYLQKLRNKRKKRKVIAIHTVPVHGSSLREIIEENNGQFLMIVREPVQTLDSQFSLHRENFRSQGIEKHKVAFYYNLANTYLSHSKNFALNTVASVDNVLLDSAGKNTSITEAAFFVFCSFVWS